MQYQISNNVSLAVAPYDLAKSGYTYTQPISYTTDAAKLRISKKSIKVAPGKSVKIKVSVIPPKSDPKKHIMYGGYVQLKSSNKKNGLDLSIPYFGVVGHQKDLPIFDADFPYLSSDADGKVAYEKGDTFVLHQRSKNAYAFIITRLITPTALLQADVIDAKTKKVIGKAFPDQTYLARHTLNPGEQAQALRWDGTYLPKSSKPSSMNGIPVPQGTYNLKVRALHVFGNPKSDKDFDAWTSGPINVTN